MIIRFIFIFSFLLIHLQLHSQIWKEYVNNPEVRLIDCAFPDSIHLKGCNEFKFLKSDDGGKTWTIINLQKKSNSIFFLDSLNGWISCDSSYILHTTDGGDSWGWQPISISNSTNPKISNLQFINKNVGFCVAFNQFLSTNNGGANWYAIPAGFNTSKEVSMEFSDALHGWAASAFDTVIYKTINGGINWNKYFLPSNLVINSSASLDFVDSLHGWINTVPSILRTNDGGVSWQSIQTGFPVSLLKFRDSLFGFCSSPTNYIKYTIDGGLNWSSITSLEFISLEKIIIYHENYFFKENYFYYNFLGGDIFKSTDLQNWSKLIDYIIFPCNIGGPLFKMNTRKNGVIVLNAHYYWQPAAYYGGTYITNDSGKTWRQGFIGAPAIYDVEFASDNIIYYTARVDLNEWGILKSNGLGLFSIGTTHSPAISFTDSLHGVHYDAYTIDGGLSWLPTTVNGGKGSFNDIYFIDQNNGWAIDDSSVFKTTNAGIVWNIIFSSTNPSLNRKIAFTDNQNGFILSGQKLFKTTNGGYTWNPLFNTFNIFDFHFKDSLHGWFASSNNSPLNGLFYTFDGGLSYVQQDTTNVIYGLSFVENVFGYALGSCSFLSSDQSGLFISVNEIQDKYPIMLSPNPVSETVTIQSPKLMYRIDLYNIQGELIFQNKLQNKSFNFDVKELTEGMYVLKILLEKEFLEKKFIVIH